MAEIKITETANGRRIDCRTPYHPDFPRQARNLGGKWDPTGRVWTFDVRDRERVSALCIDVYGTDGSLPADVADLVTLRVTIPAKGNMEARGSSIFLAGREVARAFGRDSGAKLGDGVVFLEGEPRSGGSRKNWTTLIYGPAIFEVRDIPRSKAAVVVEQATADCQADSAEWMHPASIVIVGEEHIGAEDSNVVPLARGS